MRRLCIDSQKGQQKISKSGKQMTLLILFAIQQHLSRLRVYFAASITTIAADVNSGSC